MLKRGAASFSRRAAFFPPLAFETLELTRENSASYAGYFLIDFDHENNISSRANLKIPWQLKILAFCPEYPKLDQTPWIPPPPQASRRASPSPSCGSPPPKHGPFKPRVGFPQTGHHLKNAIFITRILGKKKFRVLPTGVEPMTFRLVLRMLYHWAIGDS